MPLTNIKLTQWSHNVWPCGTYTDTINILNQVSGLYNYPQRILSLLQSILAACGECFQLQLSYVNPLVANHQSLQTMVLAVLGMVNILKADIHVFTGLWGVQFNHLLIQPFVLPTCSYFCHVLKTTCEILLNL